MMCGYVQGRAMSNKQTNTYVPDKGHHTAGGEGQSTRIVVVVVVVVVATVIPIV